MRNCHIFIGSSKLQAMRDCSYLLQNKEKKSLQIFDEYLRFSFCHVESNLFKRISPLTYIFHMIDFLKHLARIEMKLLLSAKEEENYDKILNIFFLSKRALIGHLYSRRCIQRDLSSTIDKLGLLKFFRKFSVLPEFSATIFSNRALCVLPLRNKSSTLFPLYSNDEPDEKFNKVNVPMTDT